MKRSRFFALIFAGAVFTIESIGLQISLAESTSPAANSIQAGNAAPTVEEILLQISGPDADELSAADLSGFLLDYSNYVLAAGGYRELVLLYGKLHPDLVRKINKQKYFFGFAANVIWAAGTALDSQAASDLAASLLKAGRVDRQSKALILSTLARLAITRGDNRLGLFLYEQSVKLAPRAEGSAIAYYWLGLASLERGSKAKARKFLDKSAKLAASLNEPWADELIHRIAIALKTSPTERGYFVMPSNDPESAYVRSQLLLLRAS